MRSKTFLLVAAFVVVLLVAAGGVYAYDASREDTIADGVTVGGVHVGGLSKAEAGAKLDRELGEPIRQDVVAVWRKHRYTLTTKTSQVDVDVAGSVDEAIERSRDGSIVTRVARGLTGSDVKADLDPAVDYDEAAVDALVQRVRRGLQRDPVDAQVRFVDDTVERVTSHDGVAVRTGTLRRDVTAALTSPTADREVKVKVKRTAPKVSTAQLAKKNPTIIAVDRGAFTLTLYKDLKVEKTYKVAVGQVGLETPAGRYTIQNMAENPTWHVPNSAWAGDQAGQIVPPGPANPLKARWMGIYNGAGIHGTDSIASLGSAASHGCVRMAVTDVIDLYDRVKVGTPVYIA